MSTCSRRQFRARSSSWAYLRRMAADRLALEITTLNGGMSVFLGSKLI
jgi:hypothetical protein